MTAPDMVLLGAVATLAGETGLGWTDGLAVTDGMVTATGSRDDIAALAGPRTRRIELAPDEAALPGLSDAHLHLVEAALAARRVDLSEAVTVEAGLERLRAAHARLPAEAWLTGHGWDADRWNTWPTAAHLEAVAPGRRVALWAHDHHALWASAAALATAGIDDRAPDPPGGVIRRDEGGGATGILHEMAARLVTAHIPLDDAEATARALEDLVPQLVRLGIVAVHDPGGLGVDPSLDRAVGAYRLLEARGGLPLRVHACVRAEQLQAALDAGIRSGRPLGELPAREATLHAGWLKLFADGSLGSRTATLLQALDAAADALPAPNAGLGVWMTEPDELAELTRRAAGGGITTTIHGIGDAAVRVALDTLAPTAGRTALMPRVEHAQLVADADVARFAALGVAASVQPVHVRSDATKARRSWGPEGERRGYPYGALARARAVIAFGTDAPVEPVDPWPGIACAVTRSAPDWAPGSPPFGAHNALPLDRALRGACVDPAVSAGEHDRGRLVPGHRCDLVVVPRAALDEPVEVGGALWHARPRLVLIGGRTAFEA